MRTITTPAIAPVQTDAARSAADFDVRIDVDPASPDHVLVSVSPVRTVDGPGGAERHTNTSISTEPISVLAPETFDGRGGWVSASLALMDTTAPLGVIDAVLQSVMYGRLGLWVEAA